MRTEIRERYYLYYTGQTPDRVPDIEFGYWPQTIRRWLAEGLSSSLDDHWFFEKFTEQDALDMFSEKLDRFFGFDTVGEKLSLRMHLNPAFPEKVLEKKEHKTLMQDQSGIISERYLSDVGESSIPHYLSFPVTDRESWKEMRSRYRWNDPTRAISEQEEWRVRRAVRDGRMVTASLNGFYGQLRNWLGFEALSLLFYDDPALVEEMVSFWSDLIVHQIRSMPPGIPLDHLIWWEDMASKNGPFVSPEQFESFFLPEYVKVMEEARKRECALALVDCDGNPASLIPYWLEAGVTIMFPVEVKAGTDPMEWKKRYSKDLLLRGGIDKEALAGDRSSIEKELERIKPLLSTGGFIPHLDHLAPPNISYSNYCFYLEKKRQLLGR